MNRLLEDQLHVWRNRVCLLGALLAVGCGGQVDLGGAAVGADDHSPPEPTTNEVETAARTENLLTVRGVSVYGLAVDEQNLYLTTDGAIDYMTSVLQRCGKADCWHSLNPLLNSSGNSLQLEYHAGRLGWSNDRDGFTLCHAPTCEDASALQSAVMDYGNPRTWDDTSIYWNLQRDKSIYRCDIPNCDAGPVQVVPQVTATAMALAGDRVYWLDSYQGIMRTATDGAKPAERLTLEEETTWVSSKLDAATTPIYRVVGMELDGAWIYGALASGTWPAGTIRCADCVPGIDLARWRHAEPGFSREWLLTADSTFDDLTFMHVFDGEVVWATTNGDVWSCLADDCAASKRQLGIDANNMIFDATYMVADEQFIYWLSDGRDFDSTGHAVLNIKRTPRIAR